MPNFAIERIHCGVCYLKIWPLLKKGGFKQETLGGFLFFLFLCPRKERNDEEHHEHYLDGLPDGGNGSRRRV